MRCFSLGWLLLALMIGCSSKSGTDTPTPTPTASATPTPAACANPATQLVYALDVANDLFAFDPAAVAGTAHGFTRIGAVACPAGSALAPFVDPATPYSMSVDRLGQAWVLYTSGELFLVSTSNASCAATSFAPSQTGGAVTWSLFGEAFSTDSATSSAERIWISGGNPDGSRGDLGVIAPSTLAVSTVGPIGGTSSFHPDLMGAADATLWGFFPAPDGGSVQQIDKATGSLLGSPSSFTVNSSVLDAWGAAQWGGEFYLFVDATQGPSSNSTIRTIDRATGVYSVVAQNLPLTIVSAASSTCAPDL